VSNGPVLVIAPHPDDEVLGPGGTIARLARSGREVVVVIVTRGEAPMFDPAFIEKGRSEACEAHQVLGVARTCFLEGFPAARLDQTPRHLLNDALRKIVVELRPELLLVPFAGDLHTDHRIVFDAALVAARPTQQHRVGAVLAYETLSETNWNAPYVSPAFAPNVFLDISADLDTKLAALGKFESQLRPFPNERSLQAVENLARLRGATVEVMAAEAFVLVRAVDAF
jgi:LmbE family N-acetylglucosaminyl deacetylase